MVGFLSWPRAEDYRIPGHLDAAVVAAQLIHSADRSKGYGLIFLINLFNL